METCVTGAATQVPARTWCSGLASCEMRSVSFLRGGSKPKRGTNSIELMYMQTGVIVKILLL